MAEQDVIGTFDYDQFGNAGIFLKFKADKPVTVRVLTTDPVISQTEFTDKKTGEINLNTRLNFIVYNFTEGKAQILGASPAMGRRFGELHTDEDFGANIRNIDIKIYPTGEGLERRYDIQVLPQTRELTNAMIKEAQAINLDDLVKDSQGRMSAYQRKQQPSVPVGSGGSDGESSGYQKARAAADNLKKDPEPAEEDDTPPAVPDDVVMDIGEEPINLDDIPF